MPKIKPPTKPELERAHSKRPTIGLLCNDLHAELPSKILWSIADAAQEASINLLCFAGGSLKDPYGDRVYSNTLYNLVGSENVDGLLVMSNLIGTYVSREEMISTIFTPYKPLPVISIGLSMDNYPSILIDNYAGMYAAVTHLIEEHSYQRIAFIQGPEGHEEADIRFKAYQDALANHNIIYDPALVAPGRFTWSSGIEATSALLDKHGTNLQAVITANDIMAFGVMQVLDEHKLSIPQDIALVGFDDDQSAAYSYPPLTTVRQPLIEMGKSLVQMMLDVLGGKDTPQQVALPAELVIRQSCGCFDQTITQTIIGLPELAEQKHCELDSSHKKGILKAMQNSLGSKVQDNDVNWIHQLLDSFLANLHKQEKRTFITSMTQILQDIQKSGQSLTAWSNVFSVMRRELFPILPKDQLLLAEETWLPVHTLLQTMLLQSQSAITFQLGQLIQRTGSLYDALISTFTPQRVADIILRDLPNLGFRSCCISLFNNPELPITTASLFLAYQENAERYLPPEEEQVFPSKQLVPTGYFPDRPYCYVITGLFLGDDNIGFALFEPGPQQGHIYENLRINISSTLQSARLIERVQKHSNELVQQQYILDTFMESVPDRIFFKDLQSRFTRVNRAWLKKMGLKSADEAIGKTDFDFLPPDQAQEKFQQEQEIIRSGKVILNLEEKDGIEQWASTTKMPLRDENGQIIGTFGISNDVTEIVKARQAAEKAREQAEKAHREMEIEKEKTEQANRDLELQMWQTNGQAELNKCMSGDQDISTLARNVIRQLSKYLDIPTGIIYLQENNLLKLTGAYAGQRKNQVQQYEMGEGMIGEAAMAQDIIVLHIPEEYTAVKSASIGKLSPKNVLYAPFIYDDKTVGVLELASLREFTPTEMSFIEKALESIAITFVTTQTRRRVDELLAQTRIQANELQTQEEELRTTNEELEAQTKSLRASEARLKENQAQLEAANVELEEKANALQKQQNILDRQNQELVQKARELALANKYKSEFLANMSHELRTPLNSMLILASILAKNEGGNLTHEQVESAHVIHSGGSDLLKLINEILDLAKIESGKLDFHFAPMNWEHMLANVHAQFDHIAKEKDLEFKVTIEDNVPETIITDQQRLEQIIKNLLSNAFKFTEEGSVSIHIYHPKADAVDGNINLDPTQVLAISVKDTGIGIIPEQQESIFEAFQQADGSTSRQYEGTGLGLTITRQLCALLGGQVYLQSKPGKGSTFTIYIPLEKEPTVRKEKSSATSKQLFMPSQYSDTISKPTKQTQATIQPSSIPDDREKLEPGDHILIIIEDDAKFAKIIYDFAHKKGFKCLLAENGQTALQLVTDHNPAAIVLDIKLPDISGWEILDTIKGNPDTRHIPIHIISASEVDIAAYQRGAMGFLRKPVSQQSLEQSFSKIERFISRKIKSLLIIEDDQALRKSIKKLLEGADIKIAEAATGKTALKKLSSQHYDCMILDLMLPDINGFDLLNQIDNNEKLPKCPVIVYTGKELTEKENDTLMKYVNSVIIKDDRSHERLLDETALFLHRVVANLPEEKQKTIRKLHDQDAILAKRQILIVEDDARNAFALSKLLAEKGIKAHIAPSASKGLQILEKNSDIDLILTDIMMPNMDGYAFIQKLRQHDQLYNLPIIALTAKAMKGDREKCLQAGASDYLSKPISPERLFSLLRVWLSQ